MKVTRTNRLSKVFEIDVVLNTNVDNKFASVHLLIRRGNALKGPGVMNESFHFALLRISVGQIVKASGFDKCKPSVLNALTDIFLQYLKLLLGESLKLADARLGSSEIELSDITQAMLDISFIKPDSFEPFLNLRNEPPKIRQLDNYDGNSYNTKTMDSFVNWIKYSDSFRVSKQLSKAPKEFLSDLIEKRKVDSDDVTDQEKKRRRHKERQDYYNQLKLTDADNREIEELILKEEKGISWLNYLIERDLRLGHDFKFFNSALFEEFLKLQKNETFHPNRDKAQEVLDRMASKEHLGYVVPLVEATSQSGVVPSKNLLNALPYNVIYDPKLLDNLHLYDLLKSEHLEEAGADLTAAVLSDVIGTE